MTVRPIPPFVLAVSLLAASGCAAVRNTMSRQIYQGELPDGRTVEVMYGSQHAPLEGPAENYAEAAWAVVPKRVFGPIARMEKQGNRQPELKLGRLEARSSEDGRYVWLVDVDAKRVIASMDMVTGAATGLNDAQPAWAKVDGGVRARPKPVE